VTGQLSRAAVFLDRDGVINRPRAVNGRPFPPTSLADLEILPGVTDACADLRDAGLLLIVVTNQPDVARGSLAPALLDAMHAELRRQVTLDDIRSCGHDDGDDCACRKPKPGMLLAAAQDHGIDLSRSFMVGDRWRDIEAGRRAGCKTVLIDRGWAERPADRPDAVVRDLPSAVWWILSLSGHRESA
jgi:D-glycero-D-manno-heptose 1,7-bisphosphate phosphatase